MVSTTTYLLLLLMASLCLADMSNSTDTSHRKAFSIFSIVQFENNACSTTSGTYANGTCYTASECSDKGGTGGGSCAAGFGVCCIFAVSTSGSSVTYNCSYITNPSYPSNYAPSSTPTSLSYTINKCSTDICRIRLDYDTFVLTQPNTATAGIDGQCTTDVMTMVTTAQTSTPTIAATGTYGDYPYMCGTNTGYHSYLDLSLTTTDTATLSFTIGDSTLNQWKIKVTQFSCDDDWVSSQAGCFQYHTGLTGTLQSYNYAGSYQIASQSYKNCIRQEAGYCCIKYTPSTFNLSPIACAAAATRCNTAALCTSSVEFVIIPGGSASTTGSVTTYDRYCGTVLNANGYPATPVPVISCETPFELSHVTGITSLLNTPAANPAKGFSLTYSQIPGNC